MSSTDSTGKEQVRDAHRSKVVINRCKICEHQYKLNRTLEATSYHQLEEAKSKFLVPIELLINEQGEQDTK